MPKGPQGQKRPADVISQRRLRHADRDGTDCRNTQAEGPCCGCLRPTWRRYGRRHTFTRGEANSGAIGYVER